MRPADSSEAAARRFAQLRAASRALATSLDYRVALDSVPATFVPALADWCTVKIFDSNGAVHLFVAHRDSNRLERLRAAALGASGRLGEGIIERLTHGEAVQLPAVRDALANASALDDAELDGTALLLGLVARGRMFGALTLGRLADAPWDAADIELVEEVARRAALQVDNARLYEEAINAARAREDFLATASHELRTPITSLQLELQLATRLVPVGDPNGVRSRLDAALRQTKRLTALVHELLDVSRLVAGHLELERHEVDLADLVRQVVDRFAAESTASGVPIFFHASSGATGQWDASRLDQVVTNLLANAIKYGAGRPVDVTVEGDDTHARVRVRDEGIGIDPSAHDRIFERFGRAAPLGHTGFGLGLWIARQLVEAHGGRIQVDSAPGRGSTFTVTLSK